MIPLFEPLSSKQKFFLPCSSICGIVLSFDWAAGYFSSFHTGPFDAETCCVSIKQIVLLYLMERASLLRQAHKYERYFCRNYAFKATNSWNDNCLKENDAFLFHASIFLICSNRLFQFLTKNHLFWFRGLELLQWHLLYKLPRLAK